MNQTFKNNVSGPILDRIDIWLEVPHVDFETLQNLPRKEGETDEARQTILKARQQMQKRFEEKEGTSTNAHLSARTIEETIDLSPAVKNVLKQASQKLNLSPRSYHKLIKVARTIADIEGSENIEPNHVLEALQYRVPSL